MEFNNLNLHNKTFADNYLCICKYFSLLYYSDCDEKKSIKNEKLSELQNECITVQSAIDAVILQQKIIDKKILNVTKSQKSLEDESENFKVQRDNLSLEIVDLTEGELGHNI